MYLCVFCAWCAHVLCMLFVVCVCMCGLLLNNILIPVYGLYPESFARILYENVRKFY